MTQLIIVATESAHSLSVWKDYLDIVTDPAHIMSELTMILVFDGVIGAILWPLIKIAIRKHDRENH